MSRTSDAVILFHFAEVGVEAQATLIPWEGDVSNFRFNHSVDTYEGEGPTTAPVDHPTGRVGVDFGFDLLAHPRYRPHFHGRVNAPCWFWLYEAGRGSGNPRVVIPTLVTANKVKRRRMTFYNLRTKLHGDPDDEDAT